MEADKNLGGLAPKPLTRTRAAYDWTRQLSYRKEDRAMRPIYACPKKFW